MTDILTVSAAENDRLRLFGLDTRSSRGGEILAAAEAGDAAALAIALGAERVAPDRIELVRTRDLSGMGLSGYLAAGYDVPRDALDRAAASLASAPAHVLIVPSSAFGGTAQSLAPDPALTLLAAFDLSDPMPPRAPMARYDEPEADLASPGGWAPEPEPSRRRPGLFLIGLLAIIAILLIAWMLG